MRNKLRRLLSLAAIIANNCRCPNLGQPLNRASARPMKLARKRANLRRGRFVRNCDWLTSCAPRGARQLARGNRTWHGLCKRDEIKSENRREKSTQTQPCEQVNTCRLQSKTSLRDRCCTRGFAACRLRRTSRDSCGFPGAIEKSPVAARPPEFGEGRGPRVQVARAQRSVHPAFHIGGHQLVTLESAVSSGREHERVGRCGGSSRSKLP